MNDNLNTYGTFILPYSGKINGITLTYSSGGIHENDNDGKSKEINTANWGIDEFMNLFCIHITDNGGDTQNDDDIKILYPNQHTNGYNPNCENVTIIDEYKDDTMYCLNKQRITNYKLHFIDTNPKKLINVNAGDIFRIYWSDVLFNKQNNGKLDEQIQLHGKLCVDVMVYYFDAVIDGYNQRRKRIKSLVFAFSVFEQK